MKYLFLDTCIFLNFLESDEMSALLKKLIILVNKQIIKIVIPNIVVTEFNKNKENNLKKFSDSAIDSKKSHIKNLKDFSKEIIPKDDDLGKYIEDVLTKFQERIQSNKGIVINRIKDDVLKIEELFKNIIILPTTDSARNKSVERALLNKAPFINKNSMADSIIIELFFEFIENSITEDDYQITFITTNSKDFSQKKGEPNIYHPDFEKDFSRFPNAKYSTNIAIILNEIVPDTAPIQTVQSIETMLSEKTIIEEITQTLQEYQLTEIPKISDLIKIEIPKLPDSIKTEIPKLSDSIKTGIPELSDSIKTGIPKNIIFNKKNK